MQLEVGVKHDQDFHGYLGTASIEKASGEVGVDNVFALQAEQRSRGVELSMFGEDAMNTRLMVQS
ncbi:hypothetical protein KI429_07170 [Pseudomonas shirazica]|nr:hypothetical protein KI429_07170 [Pseudomonas shirazica]